jgi:hypothetical protein
MRNRSSDPLSKINACSRDDYQGFVHLRLLAFSLKGTETELLRDDEDLCYNPLSTVRGLNSESVPHQCVVLPFPGKPEIHCCLEWAVDVNAVRPRPSPNH